MRKVLKIFGAIVLFLVVFLFGFIKYRQYSANNALIPVEAETLIKINADQIIQSIAWNVPFNLNHYLKSSKRNKKRKSKMDFPITIPASVYLYTLKNYGSGTFFCRLEISDYTAFVNFINTGSGLQRFPLAGMEMQWAKSSDGKLTIFYNKEAVAISYSFSKTNVEEVLPEILLQKNSIEANKSIFSKEMKRKDHLIFSGDHISGILNFKSGEMNVEISWLSNLVIPAEKPVHSAIQPHTIVQFWLNADLENFPSKEIYRKDFRLNTDSLLKYYAGYMDLEWSDVIKQKDTIITYEYNDDFEKVEIKSVQENKIPSFQVSLKSDAKKLMTYLEKEDLLDTATMLINTKAFPLFPLYVSENEQELMLGTNRQKANESKKVLNDEFMYLNVNFKKLKAEYNLPFISDGIRNLDELKVTGKSLGPDAILIKGKLRFSNQKINSFYQLGDN